MERRERRNGKAVAAGAAGFLVGMGVAYGALYVKSNGGVKATWNKLFGKKKAEEKKDPADNFEQVGEKKENK